MAGLWTTGLACVTFSVRIRPAQNGRTPPHGAALPGAELLPHDWMKRWHGIARADGMRVEGEAVQSIITPGRIAEAQAVAKRLLNGWHTEEMPLQAT